ncbi:MAG: hypothetical protein ACRDKW_06040 [Actinomycetota bacterium]
MSSAWYRSWPEAVPADRAYVHDGLPLLVMRDCDYATVPEYQPWPDVEPGWFLLEWDIALDARSRARFVEHALEQPERVLVAPYYVLLPSGPGKGSRLDCVHRARGNRPIPDGQPWCETFGFGCIYFPAGILDRWGESGAPGTAGRGRFTDMTFSAWHHRTFGRTPVDWTVHPQHLHGD